MDRRRTRVRSVGWCIVLGERRSEEAYTDEDCALLGSIASQMGLGFDVARLRRRAATAVDPSATTQTRRAVSGADGRVPPLRPLRGRLERRTARSTARRCTSCPVCRVSSISKYRIEQLLGRGGMGAVYQARDMRLDRLVALKVVRAELLGDADARLRFRREAQIVARLQHPSIVAVFDYGTLDDGGAFIVMELVRGEDLRRAAAAGRPDRAGARDADSQAVCAAMEAAHREGVLHRDLKPENILLPGGDRGSEGAGFRGGESDCSEAPERAGDARSIRDAGDGAGHDHRHAGLHGAGTVRRTHQPTPGPTSSAWA